MTYLKPSAFTAKVSNRIAMRTTLWDVHTLEVARRTSQDTQQVPVIPVVHDGQLYVVSTRGEADWVRNVRAAGAVRLGQKGDLADHRVTEVPSPEREAVIAAYRAKAGREVATYWKKLPDPADHPVFRLTPA